MKILQIITLSECGGAQTHLLEIIKGLQSDYEFIVLIGNKGFLTEELEKFDIPFEICPNLIRSINPFNDLKALLEIIQIIKKYKPNLIHCHSSKAGILGRVAGFMCKVPSIFTAHGWAFHPKVKFLQKNIALFSEIFCSFICSKIICVSEFDHQLALKTKLIPQNKLITIHNGINSQDIKYSKFNLENKLENTIKILMVCRFEEPKRPDLLIEVFKEITQKTQRKISLLFIGNGSSLALCETLVKKYNLQNQIKFLGEIIPINSVLKEMDILTLISEREGLPISLLEGLREGLPLIGSNTGGISEIIQNNINGYLINSREELKAKLIDLIQNDEKRKIFANNSKQIFKQSFTAEQMLEKTKNLYEKIKQIKLIQTP